MTFDGCTTKSRYCNRPTPCGNGLRCVGPSVRQNGTCPVDGGWGSWSSWSSCSKTCGQGSQTRARLCNNPEPEHGGEDCTGISSENIVCGGFVCNNK